MPNKTHGGIRKGAGRPPSKAPAVRTQITLPPDIFEMLEVQRGKKARSTYIQQLIIYINGRRGDRNET